jgi:hypothetical protein
MAVAAHPTLHYFVCGMDNNEIVLVAEESADI